MSIIGKAVREERERCAQIADKFLSDSPRDFSRGQNSAAYNIGYFIRNPHIKSEPEIGDPLAEEKRREARKVVERVLLNGDENSTVEQRQAASMFLCWPMNCVDLAKRDEDLPKLVVELAEFLARREKLAVQKITASKTEKLLASLPDPNRDK